MKVLVTGAAGFIGFFTAARFLSRGDEVVGLDNLNDYYDVSLKNARLEQLQRRPGFRFVRMDIADTEQIRKLFETEQFERVVHLGAQAGVRYSIQDPHSYIRSNVLGTLNVLEGCRHQGVQHLVYARPVPFMARARACRSRCTSLHRIRCRCTLPASAPPS